MIGLACNQRNVEALPSVSNSQGKGQRVHGGDTFFVRDCTRFSNRDHKSDREEYEIDTKLVLHNANFNNLWCINYQLLLFFFMLSSKKVFRSLLTHISGREFVIEVLGPDRAAIDSGQELCWTGYAVRCGKDLKGRTIAALDRTTESFFFFFLDDRGRSIFFFFFFQALGSGIPPPPCLVCNNNSIIFILISNVNSNFIFRVNSSRCCVYACIMLIYTQR